MALLRRKSAAFKASKSSEAWQEKRGEGEGEEEEGESAEREGEGESIAGKASERKEKREEKESNLDGFQSVKAFRPDPVSQRF